MKQIFVKLCAYSKRFVITLVVFLSVLFGVWQAQAGSSDESLTVASAAAMKLVRFCSDAQSSFDEKAVSALVDYVLNAKGYQETELPAVNKIQGAYYEFDTKINFSNFMHYAFNGKIPAVMTSPSSLRYSQWNGRTGKYSKLPSKWSPVATGRKPVIIRGLQRDAITPDLNTGIYYEYDLNRVLILLNHKGKQTLITVSKQVCVSDVGKKGVILGDDNDWNYYYSGEPGSARLGLGWVKSYIYDYFSVAVYVEAGTKPAVVKTGIFQWLRAGWNGINFVEPQHIIKGIKRYARNSKDILESPQLPPPGKIVSAYSRLSSLPKNDLVEKYTALQQARHSLAVQTGKIDKVHMGKDTFAATPKEQIVEELMLEYLKVALGKPSLVGKQITSVLN